jgi:hypothetical protein
MSRDLSDNERPGICHACRRQDNKCGETRHDISSAIRESGVKINRHSFALRSVVATLSEDSRVEQLYTETYRVMSRHFHVSDSLHRFGIPTPCISLV